MSYQQPHYVQYAAVSPTNPQAVTSLITGVVGIVIGVWTPIPFLGFVTAVLGGILAIVAIVFGHLGARAAQSIGGYGRGQAIAGLTLGYATIGIIVLVIVFWMIVSGMSFATELGNHVQP